MRQKTKKTIIGFCGRMNSGKTILSRAMSEKYGAQTITVASALKHLICNMLPNKFHDIEELNRLKREGYQICENITDDNIRFISDETNVPYEFVREKCLTKHIWMDARDIMQFVGTEIIRKYNPTWHVEKLKENIVNSSADYICIDDIRFQNEMEVVESLGGECFFILRPQAEVVSNHSSETSIRWQDFNPSHIIINETTEDMLKNSFIELFSNEFRPNNDCPILLSANEYYTVHNTNFGVEKDELVDNVIEQNKHNELFIKYGIISYYSTDFRELLRFSQKVLRSSKSADYCRNRFVIYNPLIYENLKFRLN